MPAKHAVASRGARNKSATRPVFTTGWCLCDRRVCSGLTARDQLRRPRSYLPAHGVWRDGDANDSSSVVNDEAMNGDHIARRALSAEHDRRDQGRRPARFHL